MYENVQQIFEVFKMFIIGRPSAPKTGQDPPNGGITMYNTPLCLGTFPPGCRGVKEQLRLFRETGFEGFFTGWDDDLQACRVAALYQRGGVC